MKQLFIIVCAIFIFSSCKKEDATPATPAKSTPDYFYRIRQIKSKKFDVGYQRITRIDEVVINHDEEGKEKKLSYFENSGLVKEDVNLIYDDSDNLIYKETYNKDNVLSEILTVVYQDGLKISAKSDYQLSNSDWEYSWEYDGEGREIGMTYTYFNRPQWHKEQYQHDSAGRAIFYIQYYSNGWIEGEYTKEYRADGKISSILREHMGVQIGLQEWDYDSLGREIAYRTYSGLNLDRERKNYEYDENNKLVYHETYQHSSQSEKIKEKNWFWYQQFERE